MLAAGYFIRYFKMTAAKYLENLRQEKFFKLDVLLSASKQRLSVTDLVMDSVLHHLLQNRLLILVLGYKVLMAFVRRHDEVDQDADFVAETLVIFLMAFLDDFVELGF